MKERSKEAGGLAALSVALIYVGSMIGAGFASGKEAWQFFGVFGKAGFAGVAVSTVLYAGLGLMTVYIASRKGTADIAAIINPFECRALDAAAGSVMHAFLFVAYVAMTAAGGALLESLTGLDRAAGSLIYCLCAVLTCIGGFKRVAFRMRMIAPALVCATLALGVYIISRDPDAAFSMQPHEASRVARHWLPASAAYVCYNGTAALPVLGQCAVRAGSEAKALKGAALGGLILGSCCLILFVCTASQPEVSASVPFPMMSLSAGVRPVFGTVYALFLLLAIYMAASSTFYGFGARAGHAPKSAFSTWASGLAGYALSLYGFTNFVANIYPVVGYTSMAFFALEAANFAKIRRRPASGQRPAFSERMDYGKQSG